MSNYAQFFQPIGQGQEVLSGTDPAFLADLQAKQQRMALNNAMMARIGDSIRNTPIASRNVRIGQGILQGIYMAMARRDMNEIADAKKKDAEARNAAARYQGDYLTTELDKQMNPIFREGSAEDIANANRGYGLIEQYQRQGLENNPYVQQFINKQLADKIQRAMADSEAAKQRQDSREDTDYLFNKRAELENLKQGGREALIDMKAANQIQAMENKRLAGANALFGVVPKGKPVGMPQYQKMFSPTMKQFQDNEKNLENVQRTKQILDDFLTRYPNLKDQSQIEAKWQDMVNNIKSVVSSNPAVMDYIRTRNETSKQLAQSTLEELARQSGVQTNEDAVRIVQAAYGTYGAGFGEILNSLERQTELAQRALQGSRDTITNQIAMLNPYQYDDYYTAMQNVYGAEPEFRQMLDNRIAEIKEEVARGQMTPQQGQEAVQQVIGQLGSYIAGGANIINIADIPD